MTTILLRNGSLFNLAEPELGPFDITDIAWGLSNMCRYMGRTSQFYSVAQHSVVVASLLPPHLQMQGLMHDAAEAFVGDVVAPLKAMLPEYQALEARVEAAVFKAFGLPDTLAPEVKHADLLLRGAEKRDFMGSKWPVSDPRLQLPLLGQVPRLAYETFLATFDRLRGELV